MKKFACLCLGALSMLGGVSLCAEQPNTEMIQEEASALPQDPVADASAEETTVDELQTEVQ